MYLGAVSFSVFAFVIVLLIELGCMLCHYIATPLLDAKRLISCFESEFSISVMVIGIKCYGQFVVQIFKLVKLSPIVFITTVYVIPSTSAGNPMFYNISSIYALSNLMVLQSIIDLCVTIYVLYVLYHMNLPPRIDEFIW